MYAAIVYYLNLIYWQQLICFKSLNLEQVTSKYSERLYLCLNNYHCKLKSKFNQLFCSLNVIECTHGCQYISDTLYLLQTFRSKKPLFKDQGPVNLTFKIVCIKIVSISQFVCVFIYTVVSLRQAGKYILYTLNTLCMIFDV